MTRFPLFLAFLIVAGWGEETKTLTTNGHIMEHLPLSVSGDTSIKFSITYRYVIQGDGPEPLLEIDLDSGTVKAASSITASEAGRVFVESILNNLKPCIDKENK